jgi:hypothetical protein
MLGLFHSHNLVQNSALYEKALKKWNLEFVSPSGDNLTFLCLLLLSLIVNPLILKNTFWSYKILVSFSNIFACQGEPLIEKSIF